MKLLLFLFGFLFMVLAFLYCCKKLGVNVGNWTKKTPNEPQSQSLYVSVPLYQHYNVQYLILANMLWLCIKSLNINEFDISSNIISTIYCRKPLNRVKVYGKTLVFYYEIPLANCGGIRDGKLKGPDFDYKKIEEILRDNLPEYMRNGFYCYKVYVYLGEENNCIIELYGVGRTEPPVEEV